MARDRDSPIEYTGKAHLVGVSCALCDESMSVPESNAIHKDKNNIPHTCPDCQDRMDDLWSDMYIREQINRLRLIGDYLDEREQEAAAGEFRALARILDEFEPVVRGFEKWRSGDFGDLNRAIAKYSEERAEHLSSRKSKKDRDQHFGRNGSFGPSRPDPGPD